MSRLYWAFVVPLAALFDWGRRMFETREAIRKAAVERAIEKAVKKALENERQRIRELVASAWNVPPAEVDKKLFEVEQS